MLGTRLPGMGPASAQEQSASLSGRRRARLPLNNTGVPIGMLVALVAAATMVFNSASAGRAWFCSPPGPCPQTRNNPAHRKFLNVLEEVQIASGLPMPKAFVIPDPDPNAFATAFRLKIPMWPSPMACWRSLTARNCRAWWRTR